MTLVKTEFLELYRPEVEQLLANLREVRGLLTRNYWPLLPNQARLRELREIQLLDLWIERLGNMLRWR